MQPYRPVGANPWGASTLLAHNSSSLAAECRRVKLKFWEWYNGSMQAELLTIGAELTSGVSVNTNAAYLARRLAELGIPCSRQVTLGDERDGIVSAIREALARCQILITTGGLGPTFDDVTMAAIAEATSHPLVYVPTAAATIRRFYARCHRRLQRAALRQAYLPRGGEALSNPLGTAPGLWLRLPDQIIIALPGVPSEMRAIMERHAVRRLKRVGPYRVIESRTLRTAGVVELHIETLLRRMRLPQHVQVGLYPNLRTVDVRLTLTAPSRHAARRILSRVAARLHRALGSAVYGTDGETLESVVGRLLVARRETLALAESCTGGLVSSLITDAPGSSRYLRGSVVAYHNDLKRGPLRVPDTLLARFGAVSAHAAGAMAHGIRQVAQADVGLAITGIAGPAGGTAEKPVGLVYFGLADSQRVRTLRCQFFGDRTTIKAQAAQTALDWLRRYLLR